MMIEALQDCEIVNKFADGPAQGWPKGLQLGDVWTKLKANLGKTEVQSGFGFVWGS